MLPPADDRQAKRAVGVLAGWHRPIRDADRIFAIAIPEVAVWIFDHTLTGSPRVFVPPFRPHPAVAEVAAHILAGHLERIFPNRSRYHDVVDWASRAVV